MPDKLLLGNDHDRLIRLETKMDSVCNKLDKLTNMVENGNVKTTDDCNACKSDLHNKIDHVEDDKVGWTHFKWIFSGTMGVVITLCFLVGGLSWDTRVYLERHIVFSEMVYYQVTGKQWGDLTREELLEARENWEKFKESKQNGKPEFHQIPENEDDSN
jgi:hypothetical protein